MDTLVQHLYTPRSRIHGVCHTMNILRLCVLADNYDIVQVENKVCNWLFSIFKTQLPLKADVSFIYENTTSKTAIRRLLVDSFVWNNDKKWFSDDVNRNWLLWVPEFAVNVCAVLANGFVKKAKDHPFKQDASDYMEEEPVKDAKHNK